MSREWRARTSGIVALGGTFDPIHDGHRALFERAFARGDVTVGLTDAALAERTRRIERDIRPYEVRLRELADELRAFATRHERCFEIRKLTTPTGIAHAPRFDAIVVSPETEPGASAINELRRDRGLPPLEVIVVDHVLAADGEIISSSRVAAGEIDEHGNVLDG